MARPTIRAVIFDLGNVLVDFDHSIAARRISQLTDKEPQVIYDFFFDSKLTALFEKGKISPRQFFLGIKEALNLEIKFKEFLPIWNEIFFISEKNRDTYNLARSLQNRYKLAILSNINVLHYEYIKKRFSVLNIFPHIVASCEAGFIKPQARIYHFALRVLNTLPAETFYTDDRPELIESALKLGIQALVFTGVEKLKKDLSSRGIRIP